MHGRNGRKLADCGDRSTLELKHEKILCAASGCKAQCAQEYHFHYANKLGDFPARQPEWFNRLFTASKRRSCNRFQVRSEIW